MNLARILYPVEVLGPGKRIGIWLCGCSRHCPECISPELWQPHPEYEIPVERAAAILLELASRHPVDGFTITGGEPMEQAADLHRLLQKLRTVSEDILIYSGYTLEQLRERNSPDVEGILALTAVLIDGAYVDERNTGALLRGSDNQALHILNPAYRKTYETYLLAAENHIQNFACVDGVVSVGIHKRGFRKHMESRLGGKQEDWL